ncbi:MAG: hypothetical protein ACR2PO_04435 [Methyloligellaceae bacterium]
MHRMRGPVLGLVSVLVLSVVFLRGVIHVTTPNVQDYVQAGTTDGLPAGR